MEHVGKRMPSMKVSSTTRRTPAACLLVRLIGIFLLSSLSGRAGADEQKTETTEPVTNGAQPKDPSEEFFGDYTPGAGFRVVQTAKGELNIRVFAYVRYLNQTGLEPTYTNAFGRTSLVQQRQDLQLNKAQITTFGWIMSPKLRYLAYVWTSNTSLGQLSQVVVAGNLTYEFGPFLTVGGGVNSLPGVRTTEGTFPHWLAVDSRLIADEYFRPSYTTGIWARGKLVNRVRYQAMLGNNLSQFGVDASQLDNHLNTFSGELIWTPTTGEFGRASGFGDFDAHKKVATRLGVHFTRSDENRQGQPDTEAFENAQIRISDGSIIFAPDLFGDKVQIEEARYRMVSLDAGVKYRGVAVEGEYYWRRVDDFRTRGEGSLPFDDLRDVGFQIQGSLMLLPSTFQAYVGGSKVFGEYGDPSDFRLGVNWFPWKNTVVRWNAEYLHLYRSPVGALSLPFPVGGDGSVFHTNFMVYF